MDEEQVKKAQKEAEKIYAGMRKGILEIAGTEGFKLLVSWWRREEQRLDDKLSTATGQELEIAVKVRNEVRSFLKFIENITT